MRRPKGHITHPVYCKCTGERDICIIEKFRGGSVLVGEAHGRRGEHRAGLIHNHGSEGVARAARYINQHCRL